MMLNMANTDTYIIFAFQPFQGIRNQLYLHLYFITFTNHLETAKLVQMYFIPDCYIRVYSLAQVR